MREPGYFTKLRRFLIGHHPWSRTASRLEKRRRYSTRSDLTFTLESLEPRVLLAADLAAVATQVIQPTPVDPQPAAISQLSADPTAEVLAPLTLNDQHQALASAQVSTVQIDPTVTTAEVDPAVALQQAEAAFQIDPAGTAPQVDPAVALQQAEAALQRAVADSQQAVALQAAAHGRLERVFGTQTVNTEEGGNQLDPAVARNLAGDFVVAWEDGSHKSNGFDILVKRFNPNRDVPFLGHAGEYRGCRGPTRPCCSHGPSGQFRGCVGRWFEFEKRLRYFRQSVQRRRERTVLGAGEYRGYREPTPPCCGHGPSGQFRGCVGRWFEFKQRGRYFRQRVHRGGELRFSGWVNTEDTGNQLNPAVAMDQAGNFVVAWEDGSNLRNGFDIFAKGFTAEGKLRFSDTPVNTKVAGHDQLKPAVAMDQAGNFVVAWEDNNRFLNPLFSFDVHVKGFNAEGKLRFTDRLVHTEDAGSQRKPAVAMDQAGNFVVAWEDDQEPNGFFDILVRGFYPDGSPRFGTTVNTVSDGNQLKPAVAMDAAGNFVVAWEDFQDKTRGRLFEIMARGEPAGLLRRNLDGDFPSAASTHRLLDDLGVFGDVEKEVVEFESEHLGWQWIDRNNPYRSVTGKVVKSSSHVSETDFPRATAVTTRTSLSAWMTAKRVLSQSPTTAR